ncbi:hypothetical protein NP493_113g04039 [Ridgeia piscesae]|uniref:Calpain catalytic domain-containing protein n=1 Tax=Ridgeia piscesae TaxID=27915 RepID=A0AAD9UH19_RIDPI|nr:hypothetical protein NP493_113g04039 [Ridgeia piscesae]
MSTFDDLRAQCLSTGRLFEDKDFPANGQSIYPGENNPEDWLWKRAKDICKDPKLTIDGATRFDLMQGDLGDCWFIAAAAVLATKKELFAKVVPTDQGFEANYAGIFHLNFWRFGEWVEVIIDDRFPVTVDGKLRFGQNRSTPNEFWGPLLEKAYAKLNGSYSAINVGHVRDALVDFTGGMTEAFNLRKEDRLPPELFDIMATSFKAGSLMGCGIWGDVGMMREELMWNGLFRGHAYSITHVLQARVQGWSVKLLRLRNPWGRKEWTGAWSDGYVTSVVTLCQQEHIMTLF